MKILPLPLVLLFLFPILAGAETPFAVVQDTDGFVNVRKTPNIEGEIIAKVDHGSVVYTFDRKPENGWIGVQYRFPWSDRVSGFIHESRLKWLDDFKYTPEKREGDTTILASAALKIEIEQEPFDSFPVPVTIIRQEGHEFVTQINHKPFYGTDGGLPRIQYRGIIITRGEDTAKLPNEAIGDLFEPGSHQLFYDKETETAYLCAFNSDGAGSY